MTSARWLNTPSAAGGGAAATLPPVDSGARVRRIIASILLVVGGIGIVVASTGWWLQRNFLNTERFTDSANHLLDQTDIQDELTAVLVRRLSKAAGTNLQIAEPFLAGIVQNVVDSDPFRTVFDAALSNAHRVIVDRDTETVILDLTSAYALIKGPLQQVAPNLAAQLPSKSELDVILLHRSQLTSVWDLIDQLKRAVAILTVVSIVLIAAGIAISVERWRALARAGWVVVGTVIVLLLALLVGRWVLVSQTADGVLADAMGAAYRVLVRPLVVQSIIVAAVAVVVALGARYTARRGLGSWRGAAVDSWHWVAGKVPGSDGVAGVRLPAPRVNTRATRVLRALALLAIGLFAVLMPDTVTDIVAVLIGLAVLYLAAIEGIAACRTPSAHAPADRLTADVDH